MTVNAAICDLLNGLVSNRVYPDFAPPNTPKPYITFQKVGGRAISFLGAEVPSKKNGRFQFSVWGTSRESVDAIALQVENTFLTATTIQAEPIGGAVARSEPEAKLYGSIQDFSIWSDR